MDSDEESFDDNEDRDSDASSMSDPVRMDDVEDDDEEFVVKSSLSSSLIASPSASGERMTLRNRIVPKTAFIGPDGSPNQASSSKRSSHSESTSSKGTKETTPLSSSIDQSSSKLRIRAEQRYRSKPAAQKLARSQCLKCRKTMIRHQTEAHFRLYHLPEPAFSCPECGAKFAVLFNAKQHLKKEHDLDGKHVIDKTKLLVDDIKKLLAENFLHFTDHLKPKPHKKRAPRPRPTRVNPVLFGKDCCQLCGQSVPETRRREHVLLHLDEPQMFTCNLCDFAHAFDRNKIIDHARSAHPIGIVLFSKEKEMMTKIAALKFECFT